MKAYEVIVIGGGPAGLAAALAARERGAGRILILERDCRLGGILNQCIHNGFGLHTFREELTGPEYAARFIDRVKAAGIECRLNAMVIGITEDLRVTYVSAEDGLATLQAGAIVLAMGCRERPRGALNIPGTRPAGIYSAGTAQRLMNIEGLKIGKRVVILGSGDIGLIMARRMTLEGAEVKVVAELMPYSGGLKRNIVQCLDDYGIPLKLSHTVVRIDGRERVEAVTIARVDENRRPIPGTEETCECDTLLLSVGLLPENELTRALGADISAVTGGPSVDDALSTSVPGVFACGNVLHVHDLVDFVSEEAALAGARAAEWAAGGVRRGQSIPIAAEGGVRYTVPQRLDIDAMADAVTVRFRVGGVYRDAFVAVYVDSAQVYKKKRRVMVPGEMEQVELKKDALATLRPVGRIVVRVEEDAHEA